MPFRVEIRLPELDGKAATLVEWLVSSDVYVGWDKPVATIETGGERAKLICNMPVVISEKHCRFGDQIGTGAMLALAQAEGDEIPYGKPYARLE